MILESRRVNDLMNERYIVTGGAGFIGSNLVAGLNQRGYENILVVDHLGSGNKWKNLSGLAFEDYLDKQDFLDLVTQGKVRDVKAVFHMGACSATTETDADYLMRNNYHYTRTLCEWALANGTRFIYASSAATYGDGAMGYSDEESLLPGLRPLNIYGYSKHLFDLWAWRQGLLDQIVGLKFFNVYGPGEDHKGTMRSLVHKAFFEVLATGQIQLFRSYRNDIADGEQKRDFVFVRDAVRVALTFLDHPDRSGLFNCGTGEARTWLDLARALFSAMGRKPNICFTEMPENIRDKYQYHTQADLTKLRRAGFTEPFTSIEDGIHEYVTGYLVHSEPGVYQSEEPPVVASRDGSC